MKAGVSIVLCTYNGVKRLPETLRHIALQKVRSDVPWELIVVDNASTDGSWQLIEEEWRNYQNPVPFTLLYQEKQGLTYAREMAFQQAQYDFILMCDDDNWLHEDYVNIAYDLMQEQPSIGVLGGCGELVYEADPPFHAKALPLFANGAQAKASGKVPRNFVYGAGSVIRKSAYLFILDAGFKPLLTDRVGANLSSGGDYEICFALVLAGYDIWYDERLKFKHFMEQGRLSWEYYLRFLEESSACFEVLDPYVYVATYGSTTTLAFNRRYVKGLFYYLREFSQLYYKKLRLVQGSEERKVIELRMFACKRRLSGYRKYAEMKKIFSGILTLKNKKFSSLNGSVSNDIPKMDEGTLSASIL